MEITYFGQSCFLFNIGDTKVLIDPFISGNELAKDIKVDEIEADYILLSHGHQDHVHDAEAIAKRTGAEIIANWEIATWFQNKGLEKVHPMNTGGKIKRNFGTIRMVHAIHSNSLPDGTYGGTAAGFVIKTTDKTFYFAGDTALTYDMKLIPEVYGYKLDFALLPIGDNFTMDVEDAMVAADFVQTNKVIAMHYDTFPYIEIDHEAAKNSAKQANKELVFMEIGQTLNF